MILPSDWNGSTAKKDEVPCLLRFVISMHCFVTVDAKENDLMKCVFRYEVFLFAFERRWLKCLFRRICFPQFATNNSDDHSNIVSGAKHLNNQHHRTNRQLYFN